METLALTQDKDSELFWMRRQYLQEKGVPDSLEEQATKRVQCACGSIMNEGNMVGS